MSVLSIHSSNHINYFTPRSNTSFFTHADSPRLYFFTPDLGTGSGTYIKVVLPEGVVEPNSEAEKQRDQFESILVDSGFLKDAPISTEMIARGITDQSAAVAAAIQARTSEYTSSNPSSKTIIDDDTKSTVESAKQFTSDSANWTHNAVETVNSYISAAGESVARAMGIDKSINLPEEEKSEVRKQVEDGLSQAKDGFSDIGSGISDGASQIYSSATANAHKAIDHTHGSEAADVASKAGETAKNVGSVAADGAMM